VGAGDPAKVCECEFDESGEVTERVVLRSPSNQAGDRRLSAATPRPPLSWRDVDYVQRRMASRLLALQARTSLALGSLGKVIGTEMVVAT
jgi:hypothetical protein